MGKGAYGGCSGHICGHVGVCVENPRRKGVVGCVCDRLGGGDVLHRVLLRSGRITKDGVDLE